MSRVVIDGDVEVTWRVVHGYGWRVTVRDPKLENYKIFDNPSDLFDSIVCDDSLWEALMTAIWNALKWEGEQIDYELAVAGIFPPDDD